MCSQSRPYAFGNGIDGTGPVNLQNGDAAFPKKLDDGPGSLGVFAIVAPVVFATGWLQAALSGIRSGLSFPENMEPENGRGNKCAGSNCGREILSPVSGESPRESIPFRTISQEPA